MKKIAIVTTGHPPFDDRIYWKFAKTLNQKYKVAIFCSTQEINTTLSNITILGFNSNLISKTKKFKKLNDYLYKFIPDIVICSEVSAILPAHRYKKRTNNKCKIISDITEWYPENVTSKLKGLKKIVTYFKLSFANIYFSNLCDALIIGEIRKKKRYGLICPFKLKKIIGYFPVLKYFYYTSPNKYLNEFTIGYAGVINFNRGILILLDVFSTLQKKYPDKNIKLKIAGKFEYKDEEKIFRKKLINKKIQNVEFLSWTDYDKICDNLKQMDVCFDLRQLTFIYKNSLPIKLFEYLAAGKPIIYSAINCLKKNIKIDDFGFLVDPNNLNEIVEKTEKYLLDKKLLVSHSKNAREFIEAGNNWENESKKLVDFVEMILNN